MYFSPTGTTKIIVDEIGNKIVEIKGIESPITIDFTLQKQRENGQSFKA